MPANADDAMWIEYAERWAAALDETASVVDRQAALDRMGRLTGTIMPSLAAFAAAGRREGWTCFDPPNHKTPKMR